MAEGGEDSFIVWDSEFVFEFYCEFCNEEGLHKEATGYCTECDEYLCDKCISHHKGTRFYRNHEVLDKDNMPRDAPPSADRVRKDISVMCKQHKGEPVKYYCKADDELICSDCIVKSHTTCADFINIKELSHTFFDDTEYKNFIQKLKTLQSEVSNVLIKSRENINTSEQCCSKVIEAVKQFKDNVICTLDDLETRLKMEANTLKTKDVERLGILENTCSTLQNRLDQLSSEFESLRSDKRICQTYIRMKETAVDVNMIEQDLKSAKDKNTVNKFSFIPNIKLTDFLKELDAFGKISLNGDKKRINEKQDSVFNVVQSLSTVRGKKGLITDKTDDKTRLKPVPKPKVNNSASFVHNINVKSTSDLKKCNISGSVLLSDSNILVVDYNNSKVKLIDTQSRRIINQLQVSGAPWDVTIISGDHVAVTVPEQKSILVLKVTGDSLIQKRHIGVKGKCHGIVYSKNQLIVSYCDPGQLQIMDLQGNVSVTIETGKNGRKLFNYDPRFICASNDGSTLYISDNHAYCGKVISMSRDGTMKAVYTDSDLRGPQKLCTDDHGNVFVCGFYSNNIHMLTPECNKRKVILTQTDGLTNWVFSLSRCRQTDRLFLGSWWCDEIKVYQLS